MVSGRESGVKRNFWKMGEMTACLYADSREEETDGGGRVQRTVEGCPWEGERGDGGTAEGALAESMDVPSE